MKCRSSYEWDDAWTGCNASTDTLICWPPSPAGVIVYQPCFAELRGILYDTSSELKFAAGKRVGRAFAGGGERGHKGEDCDGGLLRSLLLVTFKVNVKNTYKYFSYYYY